MIDEALGAYIQICNHCSADIFWCTTDKGQKMPVTAEPDPGGNLILAKVGRGLRASVGSAGQLAGYKAAGHQVYVHHSLTCPRADRWHRKSDFAQAARPQRAVRGARR